MLIVMRAQATEENIDQVCAKIQSLGFRPHVMPGAERTAIGITGNHGPVPAEEFEGNPGRRGSDSGFEAVQTREPRGEARQYDRQRGAASRWAAPSLRLCAGPCSVESREQILEAARAVKAAGAQLLRGGAYKPRTSPYAFQGLGEEGLRYLAEARAETGLGIVTEAIDVETFDLVEEYADCIQIGARNMQNFSLLRRAGRARKPVLLKRGMSSTLEEFLMAAEYILSEGNYQVILCERGVRTFTDHTRNTLDLERGPGGAELEPLADHRGSEPWHGQARQGSSDGAGGDRGGASGLIVEVHPNPDRALSDGYQSLYPDQFRELAEEARAISSLLRSRRANAKPQLAHRAGLRLVACSRTCRCWGPVSSRSSIQTWLRSPCWCPFLPRRSCRDHASARCCRPWRNRLRTSLTFELERRARNRSRCTAPPHFSCTVSGSSANFWITSKVSPQPSHLYS